MRGNGKVKTVPKVGRKIVSCANISKRQGQILFLKVKWKYLENIKNTSDLEGVVTMQKMNTQRQGGGNITNRTTVKFYRTSA